MFPDFKALDFYAMLGLKNDASPREIQDALARAKHKIAADRNEHAGPHHARILEVAENVLLSESGRRAAYDEFILLSGVERLSLLDHANYMAAAERRFAEAPARYGTTAQSARIQFMKEYVRDNPFATYETQPVGQACSRWLQLLTSGKALAWAGGISAAGGLGAWAWSEFGKPAMPKNSSSPASPAAPVPSLGDGQPPGAVPPPAAVPAPGSPGVAPSSPKPNSPVVAAPASGDKPKVAIGPSSGNGGSAKGSDPRVGGAAGGRKPGIADGLRGGQVAPGGLQRPR